MPSLGSDGDGYDNALAETINGLDKAEVIWRQGPWRRFEAVEYATLEWVEWFDNPSRPEPIGHVPPAEAAYHASLKQPAARAATRAACLSRHTRRLSQTRQPPAKPGRFTPTLNPVHRCARVVNFRVPIRGRR